MPALNKQSLINLLIDSPLREAIKINLIDIVNNTNDADLEKTYATISKELEIYQKATERRLKLAGETIAQLSGAPAPVESAPSTPTMPATSAPDGSLPPLPPLPPMPPMPVEVPKAPTTTTGAMPPLSVPPLDLPPFPSMPAAQTDGSLPPMLNTEPTSVPVAPAETPVAPATTPVADSDQAALQEIQKELDALKNSAQQDATT